MAKHVGRRRKRLIPGQLTADAVDHLEAFTEIELKGCVVADEDVQHEGRRSRLQRGSNEQPGDAAALVIRVDIEPREFVGVETDEPEHDMGLFGDEHLPVEQPFVVGRLLQRQKGSQKPAGFELLSASRVMDFADMRPIGGGVGADVQGQVPLNA